MDNVIFPNSVILFKVKNIISQGHIWLKKFLNLSLVLTKRKNGLFLKKYF